MRERERGGGGGREVGGGGSTPINFGWMCAAKIKTKIDIWPKPEK